MHNRTKICWCTTHATKQLLLPKDKTDTWCYTVVYTSIGQPFVFEPIHFAVNVGVNPGGVRCKIWKHLQHLVTYSQRSLYTEIKQPSPGKYSVFITFQINQFQLTSMSYWVTFWATNAVMTGFPGSTEVLMNTVQCCPAELYKSLQLQRRTCYCMRLQTKILTENGATEVKPPREVRPSIHP